jgi:voltage-gated potassium channel
MTESEHAAPENAPMRARSMQDQYGLLLVAILAGLVIMGALAYSGVAKALTILVMGGIFFLALWVSAVPRRTMLIISVVVPVVLALAGLAGASGTSAVAASVTIVTALLAIGCLVVIGRRVAAHERISMHTVLAALCIYLLVAILFALIYRIMSLITGLPVFVQTEEPASLDYIYFSFVCITTLGFGDLSPATDLAKMAAVVEAVMGQIYLVTVVALFIGNLGYRRHRSPD